MRKNRFSELLKDFDFTTLFNELGWDSNNNKIPVAVNDDTFVLEGVAQKKGFVILHLKNTKIPVSTIRKKIEHRVTKSHFEHLIIYADEGGTHQIWQLALKEENKPKQVREVSWYSHQDSEILFQRLKNLLFTLDEEEEITIVDVKQRISQNFAQNTEQVTKKFYEHFKKQHTAFLDFIHGIDDKIANKENTNKQWYASLMLNRLMFCYFIQKKGFLNQDFHYLQNKLKECESKTGKGNFYSFYRSFLLELFHDGLGTPESKRKDDLPVDLGKIPYLNGGLFDVHELEKQFEEINISDEAFKKIFDFFDQWNWHLDSSIEATGRDINPDVIGYIFEKYINDRASMGAYYTKEDITDYISKNTIIPFLMDETERHYKDAFKPDSELWDYLKESGDTYIYNAVKKGVPEEGGLFDDLPEEVRAGFLAELEKQVVKQDTQPHLWEIRKAWNQKAPAEIALPTEIYRELIERRKRYAEIKAKIENGEICHINDFITYNLNIRQFIQDYIENNQDPVFIKHFFKAIQKITILDPTCGSGAFLFAALNILEPLYEACIVRMEQFVSEQPGKHKFFEDILTEAKGEQHPNLQYFIYKSIILNNLYGVDIMKEAVEIAKLRLFLKLVATVDVNPRKDNFGLEPLPDVDFNIRAGNTLVGFATEEELVRAVKADRYGNYRIGYEKKLEEFREESELVSKAYRRFQDNQLINDQGTDSFKDAKNELNKRLKTLNEKLNEYLADTYGITKYEEIGGKSGLFNDDRKLQTVTPEYKKWLTSHQPFHWFAEFYDIISGNGGFDVIIGNPPYLFLGGFNFYSLIDFRTLDTKNLYSVVLERCQTVISKFSAQGYIVPISSTSTEGYFSLQKILLKRELKISCFDDRPSHLFNDLDKNTLSIILIGQLQSVSNNTSSRLVKWKSEEREVLFESLELVTTPESSLKGSIPKLGSFIATKIWNKIITTGGTISLRLNKMGRFVTYYSRKINSFIQVLDFIPKIKDGAGNSRDPSEFKAMKFNSEQESESIFCAYNSSLFRWFLDVTTDGSHLNKREIEGFPFDPSSISQILKSRLSNLAYDLRQKLLETSDVRIMKYKHDTLTVQCIIPKHAKFLMNQVDTVLAQHYGFTEEELDFIINYDIKYRMGKSLFGEEDNEEEED